MSKNKSLFQEFPTINLSQWEEKITKDLKGKSLSVLENETEENFTLSPYFNEENSADYAINNSTEKRKPTTENNNWDFNQTIVVTDEKKANKKALISLKEGVNSLTFKGNNLNLEILLDGIMLEIISVSFLTKKPLEIAQQLKEICVNRNINFKDLKGTISYNALTSFAKKGTWVSSQKEEFETLKSLVELTKDSNLNCIAVGTCTFQKAGANITQQIAIALSQGIEFLNYLTDFYTIEELSSKVEFHFNIGNNYFFEMAKIRAFRLLWSQVLKYFGAKETSTTINCSTSTLFWAKKDVKNNMLRATSQAMCAITAGADVVSVSTFETEIELKKSYASRIANNVHLILKEESYFDKVNDPANGSYYIENLTNKIAKDSWELLQKIEEYGGFISCLENNFIAKEVAKSAEKLIQKYNNGEITIVGVTKFAQEKSETKLKKESESNFPKLIIT